MAAPDTAGYVDTYYSRTLGGGAAQYPVLENTVDADVCVIGGGLAGLNTALGLVQRGKSVVLLEASRIGFGASGRNGGFALKDYALSVEGMAAKAGLGRTRKLYALLTTAQTLIRSRIQTENIDCGPQLEGYLKPAWRDQPDRLKHEIDFLRESVGETLEFWPREKIRDLYRTEKYYDGIFYPHDFTIHPLRYCQGLARLITMRGGRIFEGSAALKLRRTGTGYETRTAKGLVRSGAVVLCDSAYGRPLHPKIRFNVLPVATYIMVTEPVAPELMQGAIRAPYMVMDMRYASNYYRPLPDGRLLWGGDVSLRDNPPGLQEKMVNDLYSVYPQLSGVKAAVTWSGLMGFSTHKMPQIGEVEPGLWLCTGFGGHGLVPTTAGGEAVAAALAGDRTQTELFKPFGRGFTGGPLGRVAAQALYGWWRLRDCIDI